MKYYILKNNRVCESDWNGMIEYFVKNGNTIARYEEDGILVSTIFLGMSIERRPQTHKLNKMFETMVFSDYGWSGFSFRASTYKKAIKRHKDVILEAKRWKKSKTEKIEIWKLGSSIKNESEY